MKNRIFPLLLALILAVSCISLSALALEAVDLDRKGSITVIPQAENGDISGEVTLYRVADMVAVQGGYDFVYTEEFAGANLPLDDLESPELAVSLAVYASVYEVDGETGILKNGSVTFPASAGLYLVVHTGAREGENTFVPFLVVFPGTDKGQPDYTLIAGPKVGPIPEIPEWPDWPDIPDNPTEPEETEPDETEPDSTEPGETEPEDTQPVPTEPDSTTPGTDETTPDSPDDEEKLPQTGQLNWPVPLLAAAGMSLFAAGWVLRFRDRKEDYDA